MNRRNLIAAVLTAPLLSGCIYGQYFDIEWDEEVQLDNERVIAVHLKHNFIRTSQSFTRYGGNSIPRASTLTLNAGGPTGTITQLFQGFRPIFIGQFEGSWYVVLTGKYVIGSRETLWQDWGELEGPEPQWAIKLVNTKWQPISMSRLPEVFKKPNMLRLAPNAEELSRFHGKRVSLADKAVWLSEYPPSFNINLARPNAFSARRTDSLTNE
jgi:hypothetical protein